jgi:4-amino-4-deoxy-L-arabinose transferase-like glycosyltransferase
LTARRIAIAAFIVLVCALYLTNLTGMGMVSADEPRYAFIGRAMAQTGDWITPRLYGQPWFEKPALLYWMVAAGFKAGLGDDLAPRLPVALTSVAFLAFFALRLRRLFDSPVAAYATGILATSAGWMALSHVAVTDLPMAALFSSAVLWSMEREPECPANRTAAMAALGLATLAKSLVPLVLFAPVWALEWRRWREWFRPVNLLAFAAVTAPWHILCYLRNGWEFPRVLFVEHQFGRFSSDAMQHVQGPLYYLPVLLLLLFPWFPLLALAGTGRSDGRWRKLAAIVTFGFVFFSAAVNKLPGYLLPLMPSLAVLLGAGLARARRTSVALACSVALLGLLPAGLSVLPAALKGGLRGASIPWMSIAIWLGAGAVVGTLLAAVARRHAAAAAIVLAAVGLTGFEWAVAPVIDETVSARTIWRNERPGCLPPVNRAIEYGIYYYAGQVLSPCKSTGITDKVKR